jgi:hypothetical protein
MTFSGVYRFPDAMGLSRALAAFSDQSGDGEIMKDDLQSHGLAIRIEVNAGGGASRWFASLEALRALASHAAEGYVDCNFEAVEDEDEHIRIHAGGREEDLPLDPKRE